MRIAAMLLADAANETRDAKINLLGAGFDSWPRRQFPARAEVVVYLRIEILSSEAGQHTVVLDLIDADGHRVIPPIQGQFDAPPGPPMYRYLNVIYGCRFDIPRAGDYRFAAIIDGHEAGYCPVRAVLIPSTTTPNQEPQS